jgi:hypothetical protein
MDSAEPAAASVPLTSAKASIFSSGLITAVTFDALYSMLSASSATDAPARAAAIDAKV